MKTENIEYIKNIWKHKLTKYFEDDKEFFNIYVDNPFCFAPKCAFCIYKPNIINSKEDVNLKDRYYSSILMQNIADFGDVLNIRKPNSIYFGGGTSSIMTLEQMKNVFNEFQKYFDFRNVKEKHFEFNPLSTNDEKINLLLEWNFTHFTFGFQTCDERVLKLNRRTNVPISRMKQIIQKLEDARVKYNIDLLAFIYQEKPEEELKILEKDLKILKEELYPQRITIFPNYKRISTTKETFYKKLEIIKNIKKFRLCIRDFLKNGDYVDITQLTTPNNFTSASLQKNYPGNPQLVRKDKLGEVWEIYNSSSPWNPCCPKNHSVLAIGGFGKRKPYSYITDKFWYSTEINQTSRYFHIEKS